MKTKEVMEIIVGYGLTNVAVEKMAPRLSEVIKHLCAEGFIDGPDGSVDPGEVDELFFGEESLAILLTRNIFLRVDICDLLDMLTEAFPPFEGEKELDKQDDDAVVHVMFGTKTGRWQH